MGLLTVLAFGLVAGFGSVAGPVPPTLYVSPNGSDALDCRSPATACASFDRAYHAAAPGEVVQVAGGTYPFQWFSEDASKTSPDDVVLQPAPGADVLVGCPPGASPGELWPHNCLATEGADHLTVKGLSTVMLPDVEGKGQQGGVSLDRRSVDVTFEDVDAGHIFIASSDSTVRGGDFGPTVAAVSKLAPDVGPNITIDGATFHHHLRMGDQHPECIAMYGAQGVQIRNSRFDTCEAFAIFVTPEPDEHLRDVVIENNFFTNSGNTGMSAHIKIGSHGGSCTNFLIRNNTFVHDGVVADCGVGAGKGTGTNLRWIGNIFEAFNGGTCAFGPHVFDYNVIEMGKGCGPNDRVVGDAGFVDRAAGNLHLRRTSPAIGRGSPTESPSDDIDGEARPFGPLPDAGADEYVPGGEVSIGDAPQQVEGGTAVFPVTLSAAAADAVEVDWETRPANATAPEDYVAASGTLILPPGATNGEISVQLNDDALDENDVEIFSVRLTAVRGGELGHGIGVGSIVDDDLPPTVSIDDSGADEGATVDFRVRLSAVAGRNVSVRVSTSHGTATSSDYTAAVSREVVIPAGQVEVLTKVQSLQDNVDEEDEQFTLAITGGGDSATGTIRDDDTAVPSIAAASAVEGGDLSFTVSLSKPSSRDTHVRVTTSDGSAKAPGDYAPRDADVVVPAGATSATFAVPSEEDELDEDNETFTAAVAGDGVATGTIVDDDDPPAVSASNASVSEGGELVFDIALSAVAGRAVKVTASTVGGSAQSPGDFTARSAEVTVPEGATSAQFVVQTVEDGLDELDEVLTVQLSNGASATGTIVDDDTAAASIEGGSVEEGGELQFTVSLSGPSTRLVSVGVETTDGTAKAPADFAARAAEVTIPAGSTSAVFAVQTAEDALDEDDETFTVSLAGGGLATGTIVDDDAAPAVSVADAHVEEGGALVFELALSAVAGRDATVAASTADGSAGSPGDFTARSAEVTIPAGSTSAEFAVQTAEDSLHEADETLTVALAGGDSATGTIVDDDAAPSVSIADAQVEEGGELTFVVSLSGMAGRTMSVTASTADGSAASPGDFTARSVELAIPAGATAATFKVQTAEDAVDEDAETLSVSLSSGDGATGTIVDDDTAVPSIAGASAEEGGAVEFAVSLSTPSASEVRVPVATSEGTAKAPADFASKAAAVVFAPGSTSEKVTVQSAEDALDEHDETFTVSIAGGGGLATGTILDDDAAPGVLVAPAQVGEGGELEFVISLTAVAGRPVTVTASTSDGSAKSPADFTARSEAVTIPAGATSAPFEVDTVADSVAEEDETLSVSLPGGAVATGTILDDDDVLPTVEGPAPVTEGGPVEFTVSLPAPSERDVRVLASTADVTAEAGKDYTAQDAVAVLIPAGETSAPLPVPTQDDALDEADETFTVTLASGDDATGTILDDDATPALSVAAAQVEEGGELTFSVSLSAVAGRDVEATLSTEDGSATSPEDFAARSAKVKIPAGATSVQFAVHTEEDLLDEDAETLSLSLSTGGGATGTIVDDDTAVASIASASAQEGGMLEFTVSLSTPSAREVRVAVATSEGTAKAPVDFASKSADVVFAPGSTSEKFTVQSAQDALDEDDETFGAKLAGGGTVTGTIVDDDAAPAVSVADAQVEEGGALTFAVALATPSGRPIEVTASTVDGSAKSPADFTARTQGLTIPAGSTSATFTVQTAQDSLDEPDETFSVALSTGASAAGTIADDDEPPNPPQPPNPPEETVDRDAPTLTVSVAATQKTRKVLKRGLPLVAKCSEACTVDTTVKLGARAARRLGMGSAAKVVGHATASMAGAGSLRLVVKIESSAARALRKAGTVRATLDISAWDAAGNTTALDRSVKLKKPTRG